MKKLLKWLGQTLFSKLPVCALAGALAGSFVGFLNSGVIAEHPGAPIAIKSALLEGFFLGLLAFFLVLFLFGIVLHYGVKPVAGPVLLNSVITGVLTTVANNKIQMSSLAGLIGLVIGLLVGLMLCSVCGWRLEQRGR